MEKDPTYNSYKINSFFGYSTCPKNNKVMILGHNSTTIYPIDMKLIASQTLFIFTMLHKIDTTIKQKLHWQLEDQTLEFTSKINLVL